MNTAPARLPEEDEPLDEDLELADEAARLKVISREAAAAAPLPAEAPARGKFVRAPRLPPPARPEPAPVELYRNVVNAMLAGWPWNEIEKLLPPEISWGAICMRGMEPTNRAEWDYAQEIYKQARALRVEGAIENTLLRKAPARVENTLITTPQGRKRMRRHFWETNAILAKVLIDAGAHKKPAVGGGFLKQRVPQVAVLGARLPAGHSVRELGAPRRKRTSGEKNDDTTKQSAEEPNHAETN